jgi:hypothetical protein
MLRRYLSTSGGGKEEEERDHSPLKTVERGKNHSPAMLEEILGMMLTPGWSLTVVEDRSCNTGRSLSLAGWMKEEGKNKEEVLDLK